MDVTDWVTAFEPRHTAMIADRWRKQDTPLAKVAFTPEEVELVEATINRAEVLIGLADELVSHLFVYEGEGGGDEANDRVEKCRIQYNTCYASFLFGSLSLYLRCRMHGGVHGHPHVRVRVY